MAPALLVLQTKPRDHSRQRGSVLSGPGFKLVARYVASIFSLDVVALPFILLLAVDAGSSSDD